MLVSDVCGVGQALVKILCDSLKPRRDWSRNQTAGPVFLHNTILHILPIVQHGAACRIVGMRRAEHGHPSGCVRVLTIEPSRKVAKRAQRLPKNDPWDRARGGAGGRELEI